MAIGAFMPSAVFAQEPDPNFSSVSLLLHMDGANNSTNFMDSSLRGKSVSAGGTAKIDTSQKMFGTGSGLFDGAGYLSVPSHADFAFGTGDFTVEAWVMFSGLSGVQTIAEVKVNGSWAFFYTANTLRFSRRWVADDISRSWTPSTGVWYHLAATRSGSTNRLFVNGSQLGTTATAASNFGQGSLCIGASNEAQDYLNGRVDDFRITKGVARYTANFTPPQAQFPDR